MKIEIQGKTIGFIQNETGFWARFETFEGKEIRLPISPEQYHKLIFRPATIKIEFV